MMTFRSWCWICIDLGCDNHIPKPNGIAVNCEYCGNSFYGFKHLVSHICTPRQPEQNLTIEDIFREVTGNPDWGIQPIRLEVFLKGQKLEPEQCL